MKKLFKVTAHCGAGNRTTDYYVVALNPNLAEIAVADFHTRMEYPDVDYCEIATVAQEDDYGKPHVLLT